MLDDCNPETDRQVARHILQVHRCKEKAVQPPFSKDQMRRYIKFARTLNPKLTPESQRVMVDCYRKLRQGDSLGRSRSAYRITVRQLESMIRLSEALARLYCADEIQPSYVREAYRLLKTSIIQVETSDIEVDDDDDDGDIGGNPETSSHGGEEEEEERDEIDEPETQGVFETQERPVVNPGEYSGEELPRVDQENPKEEASGTVQESTDRPKKKKKKKTKISFEEYEAITNAIATHLRNLEGDEETMSDSYLSWDKVLEWYLEQNEHLFGDSVEQLKELSKKVNLVIRRLIDVDRILVTVGEAPKSKKEQGNTLLAVHPNYELS